MMTKKWNRMVLDQMKGIRNGPVKASQLAELLQLSMDSVYRRMRGDTPFTLTDLVRISKSHPLSLDAILYETYPNHFAGIPAARPVLGEHQFLGLWHQRRRASILLRDLPAGLFIQLPRLDQLYAPFALQLPGLCLIHGQKWASGLEEVELMLTTELMDLMVHRLRTFKRRCRLDQKAWEQLFGPELRTLFDRLSNLIHPGSIGAPKCLFSPEAAPGNLIQIQCEQQTVGILAHESGLLLCDERDALGRWIELQFSLRKHSMLECPVGRNSLSNALLHNWYRECLRA